MFGGVVGDSVLPAVPNDVQPGACEDAYGVGAVVAAGAAAFAIAAAPMAAATTTGTTNATGSTVHQTTGIAQITAEPGAAAQQAAQLQQPFGGDMGALLFHHFGSRSGAGRH